MIITDDCHDHFVDSSTMSFADVLQKLQRLEGINETQKRDMRSALMSLARMIGRNPSEIPANINWLHIRIRRIHPAKFDISKKRFANIKSDALRALELAGASRKRSDWLGQLSSDWKELLASVEDKHDRWKLSRFARFCSGSGIPPESVSSNHISQFLTALESESFVDKPQPVAADAARTWNKLSEAVAIWPKTTLDVPHKRQPWTFPLISFPGSFQADVERWANRLANPDPLEESGPIKPLRPATIDHRLFQIQQFASALVRAGHSREEVISLAYLVEIQNFKDGLRYMMDRQGGQPTEAIHGLAMGLKAIAMHHVKVPEGHLEELKGICARLNLRVDGQREKNRERLMQFDDDLNLGRLLHLPAELIELAADKRLKPHRRALYLQAAAAIEILLFAPLRISNLASLHLERHLRWITVKGERRLTFSIPREEVKNDKPLSYELSACSAQVVEHYIKHGRSVLLRERSDFLFPAQNGGPKRPAHLSSLVKRIILERTGLIVHAHLFRSIAGKIHSRHQPGDFATLAYVLNDDLRTAMKAYAQFEQKQAIQHYQNSVAKSRGQLSPLSDASQ